MNQCLDCGDFVAAERLYCNACRHKRRIDAVRRAQAKQEASILAQATRQYAPWSVEEDAMIFAPGLTQAQIARAIGRTRAAVMNRRKHLNGHLPEGGPNDRTQV